MTKFVQTASLSSSASFTMEKDLQDDLAFQHFVTTLYQLSGMAMWDTVFTISAFTNVLSRRKLHLQKLTLQLAALAEWHMVIGGVI